MLTVVAGLIQSGEKILVCQRRRGDSFELMWEFPGGKMHSNETLEQALARELQEELGVTARIGPEVFRTRHQYSEMHEPIELVFFAASADPAKMQNLAFEQIEWCEAKVLPKKNFLPADRGLTQKLADGTIRLPNI